ncbi:MAG TPA: hypothetical protein PKN62_03280, partial [bacterium]|nr:hypothetical protein [bacterium]
RLDKIKFVAAKYQPSVCHSGYCEATVKLSLVGANWQKGDGYKVMLAASDSRLSAKDPLIIDKLEITLSGRTLVQALTILPQRLLDLLKR